MPTTVSEAVFRQQWVGPQADRLDTETMLRLQERDFEQVTDWAARLREGLNLGSLVFNPGLGLGWEYSNRTSRGAVTDSSDDNSPYAAPSLGLTFARDYGPWSVLMGYGGGFTYYINPNYTTDRAGSQRNPINQSIRMRLGHVGLRHEGSMQVDGSYGTGENIQVGGNTTMFNFGLSGGYSYILSDYFTLGLFSNYSGSLTRYDSGNQQGSDVTRFRMGGEIDWLWTGKTTLGLRLEGGQSTQTIEGRSQPTDDRQFVQSLFTLKHSLTSKVLIDLGGGLGYVRDEGINQPDGRYTGVRPVYRGAVSYVPTEKTFVRLYSNFDGTEIVPDIGMQAGWNPRPTTAFSLSVYQNQNFSVTTSGQYQVNQGFIANVRQIIFSKIVVGVTGGWQQTENISLSTSRGGGRNTEYTFLSGNIRWNFNDWLYWQTSVWSSTGNTQPGRSNSAYPETVASTGLNLLF